MLENANGTRLIETVGPDCLPEPALSAIQRNGEIKACCREAANLSGAWYETSRVHGPAPDLLILKCKDCGCRHFWVDQEPMNFGVTPV